MNVLKAEDVKWVEIRASTRQDNKVIRVLKQGTVVGRGNPVAKVRTWDNKVGTKQDVKTDIRQDNIAGKKRDNKASTRQDNNRMEDLGRDNKIC